ncbi:tellurite resistance/C4-dicarboxylate transporter family protein [Actinacidiphila alni]|uniref:tellurite resistance/C4-dicarboxylate transporter family protein n=1 Tax=Actinacidiphila alni TaxID=380248 RepID=UPI003456CC36
MSTTERGAAPAPAAAAPRWPAVPPAAGAIVMATGIISVGFHLIGDDTLSAILLAVAAAVWVWLAATFAATLLRDRARWQAQAANPPALTAVAATCVLGTRLSLSGHRTMAQALLVIAVAVWPWLLVSVLRHWKRPAPGGAFLVCVATQGLAVLAATLSLADGTAWLGRAAVIAFCLGVFLYGEALARFDFRQVLTGSGDHWIAAGALAISALAGSKLTASPLWSGGTHTTLKIATLVLLSLDFAWYAVLAVCEILRPRLRYDIRRWSTVFPLGMTAVATLSTSAAADLPGLHGLGTVLLWIAAAVWLLVLLGLGCSLAAAAQH